MSEETILKIAAGSPVAVAILVAFYMLKRSVFPFVEALWTRHEAQQSLNRDVAKARTVTGEHIAEALGRVATELHGSNGKVKPVSRPMIGPISEDSH
jgi:hypothetical protein